MKHLVILSFVGQSNFSFVFVFKFCELACLETYIEDAANILY